MLLEETLIRVSRPREPYPAEGNLAESQVLIHADVVARYKLNADDADLLDLLPRRLLHATPPLFGVLRNGKRYSISFFSGFAEPLCQVLRREKRSFDVGICFEHPHVHRQQRDRGRFTGVARGFLIRLGQVPE